MTGNPLLRSDGLTDRIVMEGARRICDYDTAAVVHLESATLLREICRALLTSNARSERLRAVLSDIAKQELSADMSVDDQLGGDFEGAYDHMVETARAVLKETAHMAVKAP